MPLFCYYDYTLNRIPALEKLLKRIGRLLKTYQVADRIRYAIELVVEEVVSNIIKYGYCDQEAHFIILKIAWEKDAIEVKLCDDAISFDPLQWGAPDLVATLEQRNVGGLGIHLVRQNVDAIHYKRIKDRNVLTASIYL